MIARADYELLGRVLQENSGLSLGEGKEYLLESRLAPVAACLGYPGLEGLVQALRRGAPAPVVKSVCEAMTTNESLFFRDGTPFTLLREKVLPALVAARQHTRRLRIWCAAASTGQEPYSVAMTLAGMVPALSGWSVEILATDYSRAALGRAREGVYNHFEVQRGLPIQMLLKHFRQEGNDWRISDEMRRAVTFREANLLDPFGGLGTFDLVFCRNVLIYFDVQTKRDVLERMARVMAPDGYLFLGAAETAVGLTDRVSRVNALPASIYQVAGASPVARVSLAS
ncbi:MAG TPA: CheR family methyltransferase [Longimicrobiaceae bacterium]